ncbi:MAG: prolyl oligopeptidase family serine peptidase, partial [Betaproteobacteria bacterium]
MRPLFIKAADGSARFGLHHVPASGQPRALVVYLHPFAEEMNKSRRMAALQSRALAQAGLAVLQMDLLGCGYSAGDLADASWQAWQDDVHLAARWLRARSDVDTGKVALWGGRYGGYLTAMGLTRNPELFAGGVDVHGVH